MNFQLNIPNESYIVTVDFNRIEQVFSNLIFNAIRHTSKGGTISIGYIVKYSVEESTSYTNYNIESSNAKKQIDDSIFCSPIKEVIIFVKDNGLGIASEDLPNIFQRFYKGSKSSISSTKSRGLGLSITKEIVEYHGGHIWVESKINKGSTFYFSLPIY